MRTQRAVIEYLKDPANGFKTKKSLSSARETLFALGDAPINQWNLSSLVDWCHRPLVKGQRKGLAPSDSTLRNRRYHVEAFFDWCAYKEIVKEDPARYIKKQVRPGNSKVIEHNWLSEEDVQVIIDAIDTDSLVGRRDEIILRLGFSCGLRKAEIRNLTWGQIDLEQGEIKFIGKGRKLAHIAVSENTRLRLIDWHSTATGDLGRRPKDSESVIIKIQYRPSLSENVLPVEEILWKEGSVSESLIVKRCQHYSDFVGIKFTPHDMRRTYAGILQDKGVPMSSIRDCLRHESELMTIAYLEVRPDKTARAMREVQLDFD